nr:hypothetical protein CFP56_49090 [Quercus suber]
MVDEWVDQALYEKKEEESKRYTAQKSQTQTDKKLKETLHLRELESQLAIAQAKISELNKELEQKPEYMNKVEQSAYDLGQKEIEAHLMS